MSKFVSKSDLLNVIDVCQKLLEYYAQQRRKKGLPSWAEEQREKRRDQWRIKNFDETVQTQIANCPCARCDFKNTCRTECAPYQEYVQSPNQQFDPPAESVEVKPSKPESTPESKPEVTTVNKKPVKPIDKSKKKPKRTPKGLKQWKVGASVYRKTDKSKCGAVVHVDKAWVYIKFHGGEDVTRYNRSRIDKQDQTLLFADLSDGTKYVFVRTPAD